MTGKRFAEGIDTWAEEQAVPKEVRSEFKALVVKVATELERSGESTATALTKDAIKVLPPGSAWARPYSATLGRLLGMPLWATFHRPDVPFRRWTPERVGKVRQIAEEIEKKFGMTDEEGLISLGKARPLRQLGRTWQRPDLSVWGKLLGTPKALLGSLVATFLRMPYYNPYSDTAVLFDPEFRVLRHETGHMTDWARRRLKTLYALLYDLPMAPIFIERIANQLAVAGLAAEIERARKKTPAKKVAAEKPPKGKGTQGEPLPHPDFLATLSPAELKRIKQLTSMLRRSWGSYLFSEPLRAVPIGQAVGGLVGPTLLRPFPLHFDVGSYKTTVDTVKAQVKKQQKLKWDRAWKKRLRLNRREEKKRQKEEKKRQKAKQRPKTTGSAASGRPAEKPVAPVWHGVGLALGLAVGIAMRRAFRKMKRARSMKRQTSKFAEGIDKWAEEQEMPPELLPDFKALVVKVATELEKEGMTPDDLLHLVLASALMTTGGAGLGSLVGRPGTGALSGLGAGLGTVLGKAHGRPGTSGLVGGGLGALLGVLGSAATRKRPALQQEQLEEQLIRAMQGQ
jgi:hypothetical protein